MAIEIFKKKVSPTEQEINRLYEERTYYDPTSDEYMKINARLRELLELRKLECERGFQISGDTIIKTVAIVGVAVLICFKEELVGPITSKALGLITKVV